MEYGNNAPYYQWGRKDPMPPSTGLANTSKSIYGIYTTILSLNTTDIAETVCTPYYFNNNNGNPSLELWNVGNTSTIVNVIPVVKSIYDPSPAGFHIPNTGAYQGWNENGRSYWQNTAGKQGRYFYQLGPTTGIAVFFPALGYCSAALSVSTVGEGAHFAFATPSSTTGIYNFFFNSGSILPADTDGRWVTFSVRPVVE